MLVQNSPSLMLSSRSSRNTQVIEGPGCTTWLIFLYLKNPAQPVKESASLLLNQLNIEILRTRGNTWPLARTTDLSAGHFQIPGLFPQYGHKRLCFRSWLISQLLAFEVKSKSPVTQIDLYSGVPTLPQAEGTLSPLSSQ